MSSIYAKLGMEDPNTMPSVPEAAFIIGGIFQRLGGSLHIDQNGKRTIGVPCGGLLTRDGQTFFPEPVPDAKPHECFRSGEQFDGAMRLLSALMHRLHPDDKTFLFDLFAHASTKVDLDNAKGGEA